MNKTILSFIATFALAIVARADTTVKISDVHLCCGKCVKGVETAIGTVPNAKAAVDKDAKTVAITAPDMATAQKAVDALTAAGYFGKSDNAEVKLTDNSGAKDAKVAAITIKGTHLCCDKCVKGVDAALADVKGITGNTAAKGAESFEIKGDFNAKEVMTALEKAGYTGTVVN